MATDNPLLAFAALDILVVDDDPVTSYFIASHFVELGFTVSQAANGAEALRLMEARLPNLVICDRMMPEMSGVELLQAIRVRGDAWQAVTFVFATALTDRRDIFAMLPLSPDGYLCKPIDFAKADAELALILGNRQEQSQRQYAAAKIVPLQQEAPGS